VGPRSDAEVIAISLDQPASFSEIYDRHGPAVLRFLVRRVGPETAEQLIGDTFRVAFERRETFDQTRDDACPWLYGIATNLLRRHRRSEARRLRATSRLSGVASTADADEDRVIAAADAEALLPAVADVVVDLPDDEREVLLLFAWEGLAYEDIAVALDVPVGTVRSRLNRGRRRIRDLLDHELTAKEGGRRDR
jgi:RNA polymerase sigma factor (sigma-70 family)